METRERKGGRPVKGRVHTNYTIDKEIRDFINSLPDNTRSDFVSDWLAQNPRFRQSPHYEEWKQRKEAKVG